MKKSLNAKYDSLLSIYNVANFGMRANLENMDLDSVSMCDAWKWVSGLLQRILTI